MNFFSGGFVRGLGRIKAIINRLLLIWFRILRLVLKFRKINDFMGRRFMSVLFKVLHWWRKGGRFCNFRNIIIFLWRTIRELDLSVRDIIEFSLLVIADTNEFNWSRIFSWARSKISLRHRWFFTLSLLKWLVWLHFETTKVRRSSHH